MQAIAILALLAQIQLPTQVDATQGPSTEPPNILLVILDDVGRDLLAVYGERAPVACTPTIDALAARGMTFHNAWTNPVCSPSRAQILTGRYAYRTGVGSNAGRWLEATGLPTAEIALPELVPQYSTAIVGKWHLAHPTAEGEGPTHPNDTGFDYFAGSMSNLTTGPHGSNFDYFAWQKTINGDYSVSTTYATTDTADEAIEAASRLLGPWLIVASFHAPHGPLHRPPRHLLTCNRPLGRNPDARNARKMVNALDTELGRLLDSIDPSTTFVILIGDNGTSAEAILPPNDPDHGKGTMYEGGVGVPLIVAGPGIVQGENWNLVSSTDIFATVADLTGAHSLAEDSISLLPYLHGETEALRDTVYVDHFSPNGYDTTYEERSQAIRSERYKLIVRGSEHEFYDLEADPYEQTNLMGNLNINELRAYEGLISLLP